MLMKYISCIICILVLLGCNQENKTKQLSNELLLTDSISIQIPDTISSIFFKGYTQFKTIGETEYLFNRDKKKHRIDVYNLDKQKFEFFIPVFPEGPNKIVGGVNYFVHNLDSIFLLSWETRQLYLIDTTGTIKHKWKVDQKLPGKYIPEEYTRDEYAVLSMEKYNLVYLPEKNSLSFLIKSLFSLNEPKRYKYMFECQYDLEQDTIKLLHELMPVCYDQEKFYFPHGDMPLRIHTPEHLVVTYAADNNIYKFSRETGGLVLQKEAKSRYTEDNIEGIKPPTDCPLPDMQLIEEWLRLTTYYTDILYDHERECFYKIVKHKQPMFQNNENGKMTNLFDADISILIIDKELNLMGETLIENKKYNYNPWSFFVSKRGLLAKVPPTSAETENILKLHIYQPVEKQSTQ